MGNLADKLEHYKNKPIEELMSITPKWAYGKNRNKILDFALKGSNKEYTIVLVKTSHLIDSSIFSDINFDSLYTGEEKNDMRITRILSRWDNNAFVDPPTVYLSSNLGNKILFRDGQHRAKLTFFLGIDSIPIGIHNSDILKIRGILNF